MLSRRESRQACDPRTNLEQHLLWRLWSMRLRVAVQVPMFLGVGSAGEARRHRLPSPLYRKCNLRPDPPGPFVGQATQTRLAVGAGLRLLGPFLGRRKIWPGPRDQAGSSRVPARPLPFKAKSPLTSASHLETFPEGPPGPQAPQLLLILPPSPGTQRKFHTAWPAG